MAEAATGAIGIDDLVDPIEEASVVEDALEADLILTNTGTEISEVDPRGAAGDLLLARWRRFVDRRDRRYGRAFGRLKEGRLRGRARAGAG